MNRLSNQDVIDMIDEDGLWYTLEWMDKQGILAFESEDLSSIVGEIIYYADIFCDYLNRPGASVDEVKSAIVKKVFESGKE